ncbi:two component transcriptional regulator, LuxR family [Azospirillum oryzae]|jgi:DNA-binding NarL/FixJ family response regulator|uniref:Response regulator transcription factor n=1 Tax=Azospirillum oryzae TaxID=286727 RepID=A0A1X7H105_9PROT|nr:MULTISPECIES: response regulator transcription factor [Azospirillum]KAA0582562.1 response regulator transcription factor [Azospirillum sp. Sh1]KAA0590084.1 response regulator transcription factor [Azospirillum oryzae]MCM8733892.1 response regulator transcription factor [Azospirillum sp. A1-3]PWC58535.1 transcriptional regulator [Azospirillum sp. TSH7]PWC72269.1 transcriptional regulator [Azospirillum sp. TSH20]
MKILIGDDHLLFREGLRRLLEQLQGEASFVEAGTFDEVLDQCRAGSTFDIILMDLHMPNWPGFDGLREIQALQPGVPVVVISASEALGDIRGALDHGATGYIPKSSSVKVMMGALNLVFSGGIYLPPGALTASMEAAPRRRTVDMSDRSAGYGLTQRQREVLECLRLGKSNKQIAYELGLSEGTVKIHVTAIFKSLGVKNRTQAVIAAAAMSA